MREGWEKIMYFQTWFHRTRILSKDNHRIQTPVIFTAALIRQLNILNNFIPHKTHIVHILKEHTSCQRCVWYLGTFSQITSLFFSLRYCEGIVDYVSFLQKSQNQISKWTSLSLWYKGFMGLPYFSCLYFPSLMCLPYHLHCRTTCIFVRHYKSF